MLFLGGAAALGPDTAAPPSPAGQANALPLIAIVAALDTALLAAWLARARDRGWRLWLQAFVVLYGVKAFSSQLETWWFVKATHVPPEMLPSLFLMTLPLAIGWSGLAAWAVPPRDAAPAEAPARSGADLAARVAVAGAVVYPALFFLAGYFVAWQSPAVRAYYEGPATPAPFFAHLAAMFAADPLVLGFEMARGVLWVAIGWPVLRRTRGPWWVGGLLFAAILAVVQNDLHLLANPLMPREVRLWHLAETAPSNFLFAVVTAALIAPPGALAEVARARGPAWERPVDRALAGLALGLAGALAVGGAVPRERRAAGRGVGRGVGPLASRAGVGDGVRCGADGLDGRAARLDRLPVLAAGGAVRGGARVAGARRGLGGVPSRSPTRVALSGPRNDEGPAGAGPRGDRPGLGCRVVGDTRFELVTSTV